MRKYVDMTDSAKDQINHWLTWGSRSLIVGLSTFFVAQLSSTLSGINGALREFGAHQVEMDKRVQAIEDSRAESKHAWEKMQNDYVTFQTALASCTYKEDQLQKILERHNIR